MSDHPQPSTPSNRSGARTGITIAMVPLGAVLGFLGALLIEIIVGLIAGAYYRADRPAQFSWQFMSSLPSVGALVGAFVAPILYVRVRQQRQGR